MKSMISRLKIEWRNCSYLGTSWPAVKEDPELYHNTFKPITDLVAFNPLIDYLGRMRTFYMKMILSCPQLYQRIVIGSDGKVMMCSNDEDGEVIIGNATTQTIQIS